MVKQNNITGSKTLLEIIAILVGLGLLIAFITFLIIRFINLDELGIAQYIRSQRNWAIPIYFLYIVLAAIFIPLPTLPLDVILLGIFNPWKVLMVRLAADLIGGAISFYLARKWGKPLLKRWFSVKTFQQIEAASQNIGFKQFFWITMFPLINTEVMAYAGGLSSLTLRRTLLALSAGVSYRLLIVYFFVNMKW